jgi:hypothetical protein
MAVGPAAAQVKSNAGCPVNDRESPWATLVTGTWRARSPNAPPDHLFDRSVPGHAHVGRLPRLSAPPVERPGCRGDLDVPAEVPEPSFELCRLVGHLHEPVGGSVRDLPADG